MANDYCSVSQFIDLFDVRTMGMLSNDANSRTPDTDRIQRLLDLTASELESYLTGIYSLPLSTVPGVLTRWVAVKTAAILFGRRSDKPKELNDDEQWANKFVEQLVKGTIGLADVPRSSVPTLQKSATHDGSSFTDNVPYLDDSESLYD